MLKMIFLVLGLLLIHKATGLGCIPKICERPTTEGNTLRSCEDGTCGHYLGKRFEDRIIHGVDILCEDESFVYAPFDGEMRFWRPFAGKYRKAENGDGECADKGIRIQGRNQWQGYVAFISYVEPNRYGGRVEQGQLIGKAVSLRCKPDMTSKFTDHITFQLKRSGKLIDPTYHLKDCMCTGQICETNTKNEIVPEAFKAIPDYNGAKGWEIKCPNAPDIEGPSGGSGAIPERPPIIYSPIDGQRIGRIRINRKKDRNGNKVYMGCENDGVFIVGTGKWNGFTVRIYNARFLGPPDQEEALVGVRSITQRQPIARRLDCGGNDNIFIEFRKFGRLINMTDPILANNCKLEDTVADQDD